MKYVTFTKTVGGLEIELLPEGREWLSEQEYPDSDDCFLELIEHQLCNGWLVVQPEWIGALTDAIILTVSWEWSDGGDEPNIGSDVYSNISDYQIVGPCSKLLDYGKILFAKAS